MAYIGMRKPIIAPITTRVDSSAITYGTPIVVGPAVSANVTFDIADNPDYGDDIIVDNDKGVRKFETFFFHALQFSNGGENASTKQRQITWNHPSMSGTGIGVYNDDSGDQKFFKWMEWDEDDYDDAIAWIYAQFGTTPPAASTGN